MELSFENQSTNTYLVYAVQETDELDSMSLGMLTNNNIPGFAAASFTQMDTEKYIKYNVSAKVSVKQLFSGPVNKKRLLGVFTGVIDAMLSAEEYMLDLSTILLDADYIFADVTTCETELVCLPVMDLQHTNPDLITFFKNILFTTQFDQTENCDHVAQLINYLNTNPVLVLDDFKELLRTISGEQHPVRETQVQQPVTQQTPAAVQMNVQPAVTPMPSAREQRPEPAVAQAVTPVPNNVPEKKPPLKQTVVPPAPVVPTASQPQKKTAPASGAEKPMSWLYLMQHYNKDNAAIYKAQQDAKKAKTAVPTAPQQAKPVPQKATPPANAGFAIPGKQPGFAVPGHAQPVVQSSSQPAQTAPQKVQPASQPVPQPVSQPVPQPVSQPAPVSTPLNFGETTVLSAGIGETTVLGATTATVKNDPHLIRSKNNEKIPLNKPVFRIGKERSYVDYFISDNTAISRGHANIVDHNGEFFVVDTNSTNHTYVNGAMIQSGVETKLAHGDKVRLANEDFEFRLY